MQNPIGTVKCAVCQKQADRVTAWYDPIGRAAKLRVECHGEQTILEILQSDFGSDEEFIDSLPDTRIAFTEETTDD